MTKLATIEAKNTAAVAASLAAVGVKTEVKVIALTKGFGAVMKARAQDAAPRRTGKYRKTIRLRVTTKGQVRATVTSRAPQAHRLERGWAGPDKLGRAYPMRPHPHLKPAFNRTAPEYSAAFSAIAFS